MPVGLKSPENEIVPAGPSSVVEVEVVVVDVVVVVVVDVVVHNQIKLFLCIWTS